MQVTIEITEDERLRLAAHLERMRWLATFGQPRIRFGSPGGLDIADQVAERLLEAAKREESKP